MDDMTMQAFPRNEAEALAMLYLSSRDLTNVTLEAMVEMYDKAVKDVLAFRDAQHIAEFGENDCL